MKQMINFLNTLCSMFNIQGRKTAYQKKFTELELKNPPSNPSKSIELNSRRIIEYMFDNEVLTISGEEYHKMLDILKLNTHPLITGSCIEIDGVFLHFNTFGNSYRVSDNNQNKKQIYILNKQNIDSVGKSL